MEMKICVSNVGCISKGENIIMMSSSILTIEGARHIVIIDA